MPLASNTTELPSGNEKDAWRSIGEVAAKLTQGAAQRVECVK